MPSKSALDTQVGGDHYKNQGIQPFELTYANFGYEGVRAAIYTKVNKYLSRDKGTPEQDLDKAIHCLQIQKQLLMRELSNNSSPKDKFTADQRVAMYQSEGREADKTYDTI
jgi:hypothetical protein